MVVKDI